MPINFEPAGPYAPAISAAYGGMETYLAQAPERMQIRSLAQQRAMAGGGQGYYDSGDAALQADRQNADTQLKLANIGTQPSAAQQFEYQQQSDMANQATQNQAWLQQQQLSYADQSKLQQMQQAVGYVQTNPDLTDDEKQQMITQLRTGISPLQERQQAAQTQALQAQTKMRMDEHAQAVSMADIAAKAQAQTFQQRTQTVTLGDGSTADFFVGNDGKAMQVKRDKDVDTTKADYGQEKDARAEYRAAIDTATKTVDGWAAETNPDKSAKYPILSTDEGYYSARNSEIAKHLGVTGGVLPTIDQHVARRTGKSTAAIPGSSPPAVAAPATPAPATPAPAKPFSPSKPASQDETQRDVMDTVDAHIQAVAKSSLSPPNKAEAVNAIIRGRDLMAKYGSVQKMQKESPRDYAQFMTEWNLYKRLTSPGAPGVPGPGNPAGHAFNPAD